MPTGNFDNFRIELLAVREAVGRITKQTVRDDELRERIRNLFRIWISSVKPSIESLSRGQRETLKLTAELEALAGLANKTKSVTDYKKRIKRAIALADEIVLWIPTPDLSERGGVARDELFLPEIPDLPLGIVPNALLGWRKNMRAFLGRYHFDSSVFLMVRYHDRNEQVIQTIRKRAKQHGYNIILARDHRLTDDLYNPVACLLCCSRGLAVFDEPEKDELFNPNVAYELGMMHLLGRDCRVLKHAMLKVLHTDILMKLYYEYQGTEEAIEMIEEWFGEQA